MNTQINVPFIEFYESLIGEFKHIHGFYRLYPQAAKIDWCHGYGVYTIWKRPSYPTNLIDPANLIYVGNAGKLKRQKDETVSMNSGNFKSRGVRTTPYRFCESPNDTLIYSFRYSPTYRFSEQFKMKYRKDAYDHTIKYEDLMIDQFSISEKTLYSPSFLEALILHRYYTAFKTLPCANNEF